MGVIGLVPVFNDVPKVGKAPRSPPLKGRVAKVSADHFGDNALKFGLGEDAALGHCCAQGLATIKQARTVGGMRRIERRTNVL